jgi:hypothetical protein
MNARWKITSEGGVTLGTYEAETAEDALDAMAREAGYESEADAVARGITPFKGRVERV